jgi:hypothetical protein
MPYFFQVVATNAGGTSAGTMESFSTLIDTCDSNELLCPRLQPTAVPRMRARCGNGKVRKRGRCVKKRAKGKKRRAQSKRRGKGNG